jgi:threonine/homoserine/homoserine lactone efflux protein
MIPAGNLLAFLAVAVPFALLPGPSVLFVIGRSLSLGRRGGLLSVLGNALGALVTVLAVSFGVGILIAQSIVVFTIVKVAGAAYLIYLGVQAIRHRHDRAASQVGPAARIPAWRVLLQAFIVGVSNPKSIVFFIAVLPQFVDHATGSIPLQMSLLGAIFVVVALLTDSVWSLVAGAAREWFGKSPRRLAGLGTTGGVMMIGLGTVSLFVGNGKE